MDVTCDLSKNCLSQLGERFLTSSFIDLCVAVDLTAPPAACFWLACAIEVIDKLIFRLQAEPARDSGDAMAKSLLDHSSATAKNLPQTSRYKSVSSWVSTMVTRPTCVVLLEIARKPQGPGVEASVETAKRDHGVKCERFLGLPDQKTRKRR